MPNRLVCLFLLALCLGCEIEKKVKQEFGSKLDLLFTDDQIRDFDIAIIIPGAGCPGCVSNAEKLVTDHFDESSNLVVTFTAYHSQKILRLKLGLDLDSDRIHLDEQNVFNSDAMYSFYPAVF